MPIVLCRNSDKSIGGLFNKSFTVHTATQSHDKWEMRRKASDEAVVVTEVPVMGMERRASVIQSNYFKTTPELSEEDDERNDKVITC